MQIANALWEGKKKLKILTEMSIFFGGRVDNILEHKHSCLKQDQYNIPLHQVLQQRLLSCSPDLKTNSKSTKSDFFNFFWMFLNPYNFFQFEFYYLLLEPLGTS